MNYRSPLFLLLSFILAFLANGQESNSLQEKKSKSLISFLADSVKLPSLLRIDNPEKYYLPFVIARLESEGVDDKQANDYIRSLAQREPYYYSLVGAVRLIYKYPECPAVRENMQLLVKNVFEREDSYNAWTGEGLENHINMSRTSAYLFAQKAQLYGRFFPNSKQKLEDMKKWVLGWSSRVYEVGTAEFNSGVDGVYNLIGWLNLYDFAEDEEVQLAAKAVLDYYAAEMALHYFRGYVAGVEMKGTKLSEREQSASWYYNWFWFGVKPEISFDGTDYMQLVHAVTSNYRPPSILVDYANEKPDTAQLHLNSKPSYLLNKPSFNKHFYYSTPNFTLGSQLSAYGGFTKGSSEFINWKLMIAHKDTISEVRGNGVFWNNYDGIGKDPWTQWGQHRNVLIQLTKVPTNARGIYEDIDNLCDEWNSRWKKDFKKRFRYDVNKKNVYEKKKDHRFENESYLVFPDYAAFSEKSGVWFVDFGSTYMAVVGIPTHLPVSLLSFENKKLLVVRNDPGKICGFVCEVVDATVYNSYDDFKDTYIKDHIMYLDHEQGLLTYESVDGKHIEFLFQNEGSFSEPMLDWGYGVKEQLVILHLAPFMQPDWPLDRNTGRVPVFIAENSRYEQDDVWPVFSGPVINLDQSILTINFNDLIYKVDYTSRVPVFSEE